MDFCITCNVDVDERHYSYGRQILKILEFAPYNTLPDTEITTERTGV